MNADMKGCRLGKMILVVGAALSMSACIQSQRPIWIDEGVSARNEYVWESPGVTQYLWEEPMVDVIDVPPGLDPEWHYYRPGHQEIVEIRQGRWEYYRPRANESERR